MAKLQQTAEAATVLNQRKKKNKKKNKKQSAEGKKVALSSQAVCEICFFPGF